MLSEFRAIVPRFRFCLILAILMLICVAMAWSQVLIEGPLGYCYLICETIDYPLGTSPGQVRTPGGFSSGGFQFTYGGSNFPSGIQGIWRRCHHHCDGPVPPPETGMSPCALFPTLRSENFWDPFTTEWEEDSSTETYVFSFSLVFASQSGCDLIGSDRHYDLLLAAYREDTGEFYFLPRETYRIVDEGYLGSFAVLVFEVERNPLPGEKWSILKTDLR